MAVTVGSGSAASVRAAGTILFWLVRATTRMPEIASGELGAPNRTLRPAGDRPAGQDSLILIRRRQARSRFHSRRIDGPWAARRAATSAAPTTPPEAGSLGPLVERVCV
jgi:hypothetical protein